MIHEPMQKKTDPAHFDTRNSGVAVKEGSRFCVYLAYLGLDVGGAGVYILGRSVGELVYSRNPTS